MAVTISENARVIAMPVLRRHKGKAKKQLQPQASATFFDLSHELMKQFSGIANQVAYTRRSTVFHEGDLPHSVYLVCEGEVKLFASSHGHRRMILRIARIGDVLGLSAALNDLPHEVTAETLGPCTFKQIGRRLFLEFLGTYAEAAHIAALTLARECREIFVGTRRLALSSSAAARIAQVLIGFMPLNSKAGQTPSFPMTLTHAELASLAGTSRETVARMLNQLERDGIIIRDNTTLTILKPSQLEQIAF